MPKSKDIIMTYNQSKDIFSIDYDPFLEAPRVGVEVAPQIILGVNPLGRIMEIHITRARENLARFVTGDSDTLVLPRELISRKLHRNKINYVLSRRPQTTQDFLRDEVFF